MFAVSLCMILAAAVAGQQEGAPCGDHHSNTASRCKPAAQCVSAKQNFVINGTRPAFCSSPANGQVLVCCQDILKTHNSSDAEHIPSLSSGDQQTTERVSQRKCKEYSKSVEQKVENIPLILEPNAVVVTSECDPNVIHVTFLGGDNAQLAEFPHMAAIGWMEADNQYKFYCGGSLISPKFVLTAAQCSRRFRAVNPAPSIVRLGDHNLDNKVDDGATPIDVPIQRIHSHPDFKPPRLVNNIALLELGMEVVFNSHIRAACLWDKPDFSGRTKAVNSGWEPYSSNNEESKQLKKVFLSLMENEQCDPLVSGSARWQPLADTQMCASNIGAQDSCEGEIGSPLQVADSDNPCIHKILGVTSVGRKCGDSRRPSVYTRVYSYLDWIENIVWPGE